MKKTLFLILLALLCRVVNAAELRVSSTGPVVVTAPYQWRSEKAPSPGGAFPFETFRLQPPGNLNAECLISVLATNKQAFTEPQRLKKLVRMESRPYVNSPDELAKIEVKELNISGGLGYYANFVDPELVGKPVRKGSYKTATPIILALGSNYLIKVTVLCDEIDGADYKDAIKALSSIRTKRE